MPPRSPLPVPHAPGRDWRVSSRQACSCTTTGDVRQRARGAVSGSWCTPESSGGTSVSMCLKSRALTKPRVSVDGCRPQGCCRQACRNVSTAAHRQTRHVVSAAFSVRTCSQRWTHCPATGSHAQTGCDRRRSTGCKLIFYSSAICLLNITYWIGVALSYPIRSRRSSSSR
jgi:hypothetical protein